jgi:hypothetical protein
MAIPKSKMAQLKKGFQRKKELDENKSGGAKSNATSIFFKALEKNETQAKYDVFLFTPSFALPKYEEELSVDPALSTSFSVDHHEITIGKKGFFSIPCQKQSIKYDFVLETDHRCPICEVGYKKRQQYFENLNAKKEEYGSWQEIPDQIKSEMKEENKLQKSLYETKTNNYVAGIFIKAVKGVDGEYLYEPIESVKWFKSPINLMSSIKDFLDDGEYVFAEDYDTKGNISKKEYTPEHVLKLSADRNGNPYYSVNFMNNKKYSIKRVDNETVKLFIKDGDEVVLEKDLKIPDIYSYFENIFSDWEGKTSYSKFAEQFSLTENDSTLYEKIQATKKVEKEPSPDKEENDYEDEMPF